MGRKDGRQVLGDAAVCLYVCAFVCDCVYMCGFTCLTSCKHLINVSNGSQT